MNQAIKGLITGNQGQSVYNLRGSEILSRSLDQGRKPGDLIIAKREF